MLLILLRANKSKMVSYILKKIFYESAWAVLGVIAEGEAMDIGRIVVNY